MKKLYYFSTFFATWFKTGLLKPIPPFKGMAGTYGSFFALPLCYLAIQSGRIWGFDKIQTDLEKIIIYLAIIAIFFVFGLLTIPLATEELGPQTDWKGKTKIRDQNQIVIDEVVGMLVSCVPILFAPKILVIHFILAFGWFRFFDIAKIWPTKIFDRMKNSFGVMFDDVIAGAYSAIVLQLLISYIL